MELAMNLGELIEELTHCPQSMPVQFNFGNFRPKIPLLSYRGSYDELAIGYTKESEILVREFRIACEAAVDKIFEGYKGGDFRMTLNTPLWAANWGEYTCTAITNTHHIGHSLILMTDYIYP